MPAIIRYVAVGFVLLFALAGAGSTRAETFCPVGLGEDCRAVLGVEDNRAVLRPARRDRRLEFRLVSFRGNLIVNGETTFPSPTEPEPHRRGRYDFDWKGRFAALPVRGVIRLVNETTDPRFEWRGARPDPRTPWPWQDRCRKRCIRWAQTHTASWKDLPEWGGEGRVFTGRCSGAHTYVAPLVPRFVLERRGRVYVELWFFTRGFGGRKDACVNRHVRLQFGTAPSGPFSFILIRRIRLNQLTRRAVTIRLNGTRRVQRTEDEGGQVRKWTLRHSATLILRRA